MFMNTSQAIFGVVTRPDTPQPGSTKIEEILKILLNANIPIDDKCKTVAQFIGICSSPTGTETYTSILEHKLAKPDNSATTNFLIRAVLYIVARTDNNKSHDAQMHEFSINEILQHIADKEKRDTLTNAWSKIIKTASDSSNYYTQATTLPVSVSIDDDYTAQVKCALQGVARVMGPISTNIYSAISEFTDQIMKEIVKTGRNEPTNDLKFCFMQLLDILQDLIRTHFENKELITNLHNLVNILSKYFSKKWDSAGKTTHIATPTNSATLNIVIRDRVDHLISNRTSEQPDGVTKFYNDVRYQIEIFNDNRKLDSQVLNQYMTYVEAIIEYLRPDTVAKVFEKAGELCQRLNKAYENKNMQKRSNTINNKMADWLEKLRSKYYNPAATEQLSETFKPQMPDTVPSKANNSGTSVQHSSSTKVVGQATRADMPIAKVAAIGDAGTALSTAINNLQTATKENKAQVQNLIRNAVDNYISAVEAALAIITVPEVRDAIIKNANTIANTLNAAWIAKDYETVAVGINVTINTYMKEWATNLLNGNNANTTAKRSADKAELSSANQPAPKLPRTLPGGGTVFSSSSPKTPPQS